jgi:ppGpp synthetase/RelA/SpoT-type nucleotidyltranferase
MSLRVTNSQIDKFVAPKLENALVAQTLTDPTMHSFVKASVTDLPAMYIPRHRKRRNRIYEKVKRYLKEHPRASLQTAVDHLYDLAGGRFLVHYISDVNKLHSHICSEIESSIELKILGECRDCITQSRESGFRALTQNIVIKIGRIWVPFEIQFMTYLGHDWDQKQHIIYENQVAASASVLQAFRQLSETLFQADQAFDTIRPLLKKQ